MNELSVEFNFDSPQNKFKEIIINVNERSGEKLLYKYMIGSNGRWRTLKNYSVSKKAIWIPREDGNYIIMIQAKKINSNKPFDYITKCQYSIGEMGTKLIEKIELDKNQVFLGDIINIKIDSNKKDLLYRYIINEDEKLITKSEYIKESFFTYSPEYIGNHTIYVQCKNNNSNKEYEDTKNISAYVLPVETYKIKSCIPLDTSLVTGQELKFKVELDKLLHKKPLYKFDKIDCNNETHKLQEYSSNNVLTYIEEKSGNYELMIYVKSESSNEEFQDRYKLLYYVKNNYINLSEEENKNLKEVDIEEEKDIIIEEQGSNQKVEEENQDIEIETDDYDEEIIEQGIIEEEIIEEEIIEEEIIEEEIIEEEIQIDEVVAIDLEPSQEIEKNSKPKDVKIQCVLLDKQIKNHLKSLVYMEIQAIGGTNLLYSFKITNNKRREDYIDYSYINNFTIELNNEDVYTIEACVKDDKSEKLYDSKSMTFIYTDKNKLDYSLINIKDNLLMNEFITIDFHKDNNKESKFKYIINYENVIIDETKFSKNTRLIIKPLSSGQYTINIVEKNNEKERVYTESALLEVEEYEKVAIKDIHIDKTEYLLDIPITISVDTIKGKEIMYEFYYKEKDNWVMAQEYSKKNYYTYLPTKEGKISFFVIVKSTESNGKYDDYKKVEIRAIN